jgi:hypothetical protein
MSTRRPATEHVEPSAVPDTTLVAALSAAAAEVGSVARRIGPRFARAEARQRAQAYLRVPGGVDLTQAAGKK